MWLHMWQCNMEVSLVSKEHAHQASTIHHDHCACTATLQHAAEAVHTAGAMSATNWRILLNKDCMAGLQSGVSTQYAAHGSRLCLLGAQVGTPRTPGRHVLRVVVVLMYRHTKDP